MLVGFVVSSLITVWLVLRTREFGERGRRRLVPDAAAGAADNVRPLPTPPVASRRRRSTAVRVAAGARGARRAARPVGRIPRPSARP